MNNTSKALKIVGLIIMLIAFLLKSYYYRLGIIIFGILIITLSMFIKAKKKSKNIILIPILLIIITYFVDVLLVYTLKFYPIYSYKIKSADNFVNYNGIGYRVFECDNKKYIDLLYKKSNYCKYANLEEKDINTFSSEIVSSFNNYKNKFIVLNAKVSHKKGNDYLELKSYNSIENNMNGNVEFNDNIIYILKNLKEIDNIKVYDNVKVVGRITEISHIDNTYKIIIKDAYVIEDKIYNDYKINVVEDKKCQKDKSNYVKTKNYNYYTSCITNIYVIFDEEEVYELNYVLKDEKITLENLIKNYKKVEEKEEKDATNKLYIFDDYRILLCGNSDNVIIGNKKLDLENNYCKVSDVDNNEL